MISQGSFRSLRNNNNPRCKCTQSSMTHLSKFGGLWRGAAESKQLIPIVEHFVGTSRWGTQHPPTPKETKRKPCHSLTPLGFPDGRLEPCSGAGPPNTPTGVGRASAPSTRRNFGRTIGRVRSLSERGFGCWNGPGEAREGARAPQFPSSKRGGWRSLEGRRERPEGHAAAREGFTPRPLQLCSLETTPPLQNVQSGGLGRRQAYATPPPQGALPRQQTNPCGVPSPSPGGPASLGKFLSPCGPTCVLRSSGPDTAAPGPLAFSCGAHGTSRSACTESPRVQRPAAHARPVAESFGMPGLEPRGHAALLAPPRVCVT